MRYKFLTSSERAWRAMFESIKGAKESVYLEMYIFVNDMTRYDFISLLKEKAKNGLRIKIILDSLGSRELSNDDISKLRESGVELIFLSYFLYRTHRKILIVDEKVAFIGGVNLSQKFKLWDDLVVEISSKKLVHHTTKSFAKVYGECGGKDQNILSRKEPIILDKTHTWIVEHFPIKKKFSLKKIYKKHLSEAKNEIILITPYFMPKRWLIGVLHQAVLRGVRVEILVPKTTDIYIIDRVNYFYMFKLSKLGVNFYLESKMNHAKVMIIDSKEGIVGSNNLDFFSFELNSEVGIFFKDLNVVEKLSGIAKEWRDESVLFNFRHHKPKLLDYILSPIISLFTKIF